MSIKHGLLVDILSLVKVQPPATFSMITEKFPGLLFLKSVGTLTAFVYSSFQYFKGHRSPSRESITPKRPPRSGGQVATG